MSTALKALHRQIRARASRQLKKGSCAVASRVRSARGQRFFARCGGHCGYIGRITVEKAPRLVSPRSRVIHSDTGRAADPASFGDGRRFDPQRPTAKIGAREPPIYVHGFAKQTRTPGFASNVAQRLDGAYQYRVWDAVFASHYVQAIPHAINQIDVGVTRRTVHDGVALCSSRRRVCRQILWTLIRLGLDDATCEPLATMQPNQMHADEFTRHRQSTARVEIAS